MNGFASVMIFFEWVCSGDDFFDWWPGFQIGGVGLLIGGLGLLIGGLGGGCGGRCWLQLV